MINMVNMRSMLLENNRRENILSSGKSDLMHRGDPHGITSLAAKGTATPTFARSGTRWVKRYVGGVWTMASVADGVVPVGIDANGNYTISCEPSSANIIKRSQNLASWDIIDKCSIDSANALHPSPINGVNFDGIIANGVSSSHTVAVTTVSFPASAKYVGSILMKPGDKQWVRLSVYSSSMGANSAIAFYNVSSGEIGTLQNAIAGVIPYGDGAYRLYISPIFNLYNEATYFYVRPAVSDGVVTFAGDSATVNTWAIGAQFQLGTYPDSYIGPTTTATVVRNADNYYYKGDDGNLGGVGSDRRGTLRLKISTDDITLDASRMLFSLSDGGSSADEILLTIAATTGYVSATITASGGTPRTIVGPSIDVLNGSSSGHIVQLSYEAGRAVLWVDGTPGAENTDVVSADIPDDLDMMRYGYFPIADERFFNPPRWSYVA